MILAEALSADPIRSLYPARALSPDSPKYQALRPILEAEPVSFFLGIHEALFPDDPPLVIVTDWTDPCEVVGLRLETDAGITEYPDLCFLGLYTDWDAIEKSGIETIFAHELSHLWLHRLGFDIGLSQSNRFHTCTAITDPYMAFSEGFAEHLEIVSGERMGLRYDGFYDQGYDLNAWLSYRDSALRVHAVRNNRFLYLTADPEPEELESYARFHAAHNTSSAFLPERLKNGSQAIASEGLIASFFYQLYKSVSPADDATLARFYADVLHTLKQLDLRSPSLFTDFVSAYMAHDPQTLEIFGQVTNFVTLDPEARKVFGDFYRIGRLGDPEELQAAYPGVKGLKERCKATILSGAPLDAAVFPSLWITADKTICPIPWEPDCRVPLKFDINAATAADFYALNGLTFHQCRQLESHRDAIGGFRTMEEFGQYLSKLRPSR